MTTLPVSTLSGVSARLRPLSGFEHLFWAVDKINGFNFAIAFSFSGNVAHARWKAAFEQVQQRHPFLNAGINEEDPLAPFFTRGAGLPIPLVFQRRASSADWRPVMESEVAKPFDLSKGPLLRAAILEDDKGCDLVITAHHAIIDGMGSSRWSAICLRSSPATRCPICPCRPLLKSAQSRCVHRTHCPSRSNRQATSLSLAIEATSRAIAGARLLSPRFVFRRSNRSGCCASPGASKLRLELCCWRQLLLLCVTYLRN